MTLKPNPLQKFKKSRKVYEKGYYWENNAKTLLLKKYSKDIIFLIKAPYSYPFDLLAFSNDFSIWLIEVRYRYFTNVITMPKTKLRRIREFISKFRKARFRLLLVGFYQTKYNYCIKDLSEFLTKNRYPPKIIIPVNNNNISQEKI
jgi:hypothetical protein